MLGMQTSRTSGYTLIELLVVMGISILIMSALLYFFSGSITSYRSQVGHIFATADARNQLQRIVDTLRNAQDNQSTGDAWLAEAEDNAVTVWTNIGGDTALEKVQYRRSTTDETQLIRAVLVGDPTGETVIAQRLTTPVPLFTYYDSNGSAITDIAQRTPDAVKTIGIAFTLSLQDSQNAESQVITTKVTPRQRLQGTISQTGTANGDREVTIELPRGNPPAVADPAKLIIQDMTTGAVVVNKDLPIPTLNDGRLRAYGRDDYAFVNYKNTSSLGYPANWYVWLTWGVPVQQMSSAILLDYFYTGFGSSKVECLGKTLSQALASPDCAVNTYPWSVPYLPILTYVENGYRDHVRDIYVKPPVLLSFTSTTANGTYGPGGTIQIKATYDQAIKSGSTMSVRLDTGVTVPLSTISGATISGTYTVGALASGENSSDLTVSSITAESITDAATGDYTRTNSSVPVSPNNIRDSSAIVVDTTLPASSVVGQYLNQTPPLIPTYTKGDGNNGEGSVNSNGLANPSAFTVGSDFVGVRYLFVADRDNNRVLVYTLQSGTGLLTDPSPDFVLGQSTFTSNTAPNPPTSSSMNAPSGVGYDPEANLLFVADTGNNRVLVFQLATGLTNNKSASFVLGQSTFTSNTAPNPPTSSSMNAPSGVGYDSASSTNRLFVADTGNNRVLVFNITASLASGQAAIRELGQPSGTAFTSTLAPNPPTSSSMNAPSGVAYSSTGTRLYVSDGGNNRVLSFNVSSISNGKAAVNVLGQSTFTSNTAPNPPTSSSMNAPSGVATNSSNTKLYTVDSMNNRALLFDLATVTNGEAAVKVFGQDSFLANGAATTQLGLRSPVGTLYDSTNNKLFISDSGNNRFLIFNQ
jgi:DNA-binding beta-propeller fold protein YncE/type II secretory pathway pseudopilin PulG